MFEYYSSSRGHIFEGVEVLRYSITLPSFPEAERISLFYRDVFDAVLSYCNTELTAYAEKRYAECELPKKRFTYTPVCYRLDGRVTHDDGELTFVKLTATVGQREPKLESLCALDAHAWSLSEQCLLPPRQAARRIMGKGKISREIGKNGFLAENGKMYVCFPDRLAEIGKNE
ncbi:MAG: hypothetical protein IJ011_02635 [Clostridia bacterium]|nr:hypothetical protein [Clostridia bacterium]